MVVVVYAQFKNESRPADLVTFLLVDVLGYLQMDQITSLHWFKNFYQYNNVVMIEIPHLSVYECSKKDLELQIVNSLADHLTTD